MQRENVPHKCVESCEYIYSGVSVFLYCSGTWGRERERE